MIDRSEQKRQTHRRILDAAAVGLRTEGLAGASVARVMGQAGLTVGGFYGHFPNKAALVAEAIHRSARQMRWLLFADLPEGRLGWRQIVRRYVSRAHRDLPGEGCFLPSLTRDVADADPAVRAAFAADFVALVDELAAHTGDDDPAIARARALSSLAAMVGSIALSRALRDHPLSDEILNVTRRALDSREVR
jgi:TetR/AcrR family transcriptional repressor of nem operon